jgi:hypothetical protein
MKRREEPIAILGPLRKPSEAVFVGKGGRNEAGEVHAGRQGRSGAEFLPTRRMPWDAKAAVWMAEAEALL